jgi:hypothetical protein
MKADVFYTRKPSLQSIRKKSGFENYLTVTPYPKKDSGNP